MEAHLRAGIAIFNAGGYHTAHDAWEEHWLDLESGTDDELFLHGLIQYTAAVHHARNRNWGGATGLAASAGEYLSPLPPEYRSVNIGTVREFLSTIVADPECIERATPLPLTHQGVAPTPDNLDFEATAIAAEALAEKRSEESLLEQGVAFARADLDGTDDPLRGETDSPFIPLVFDYVRDGAQRPIIAERLGQHIERRSAREDDVAGLFEPRTEEHSDE